MSIESNNTHGHHFNPILDFFSNMRAAFIMSLEIQPSYSSTCVDCSYYLCNTFATAILIFSPLDMWVTLGRKTQDVRVEN